MTQVPEWIRFKKTERALKIVFSLHPKTRVTKNQLAERLGVCRRTIERDIDFLSCLVPIYTDDKGITIMEGWWKQFE